jgi:hypothetical protein
VVPVSGKGSGRISIAGLVCVKPGRRPRLIYRTIAHRGRKNERRSFSEADYIALLDAAHQQLGGPIVLIWDNLNVHISAAMRRLIAARDWLHVIRLPAYAPDLNPTEGVWSHCSHGVVDHVGQGDIGIEPVQDLIIHWPVSVDVFHGRPVRFDAVVVGGERLVRRSGGVAENPQQAGAVRVAAVSTDGGKVGDPGVPPVVGGLSPQAEGRRQDSLEAEGRLVDLPGRDPGSFFVGRVR